MRPLSNREVVEKFRALTAQLIGQDRARAIETNVLNIQELDDVGELLSLLAAPVAAIFAEAAAR